MARWLVWAVVSVILWGAWALVFSAASALMHPFLALVLSTAGLVPVAAGLLFTKDVWKRRRLLHGVAWGIATGAAGALGNAAFSAAILDGAEASVVTPLTAMYPLLTVVLAVIFLRERINRVQFAGIVAALVSIFLFDGADSNGALAMGAWVGSLTAPWMIAALVALVLYGATGVTLKLATNDISNELSTITYLVGSAFVAFIVLATGQFDWSLTAQASALALGSGVLMGLALWAGFAAYRAGKAAIITALLALYPVVTVFLAILILGDIMNLTKVIAIVLALLAGLSMAYEGRHAEQAQTRTPAAGSVVNP